MKKIALISLGCEKNLVDSENILGLLVKNHYQIVSNKDLEILLREIDGHSEDGGVKRHDGEDVQNVPDAFQRIPGGDQFPCNIVNVV